MPRNRPVGAQSSIRHEVFWYLIAYLVGFCSGWIEHNFSESSASSSYVVNRKLLRSRKTDRRSRDYDFSSRESYPILILTNELENKESYPSTVGN